jgi:hypothetical protein
MKDLIAVTLKDLTPVTHFRGNLLLLFLQFDGPWRISFINSDSYKFST